MGGYPPEWDAKIKELLIPGTTLELCCGAGRFNHLFGEYLGTDVNQELCDKNKGKTICCDLADFKWKYFDNIFDSVGIQHILNPPFKEMKKHAKNIVLIETVDPNIKSDYQFYHDYEKEGFEMVERLNGLTYLMHWRKK